MKDIYEGTELDLDRVYGMMKEDFPEEEIRGLAQMRSSLRDDKYKLYILGEKDCAQISGYAMVYEIEKGRYYWLDYLAVHKDCRNRGYGMRIVQEILSRDKSSMGMFIEIEKALSEDEMELLSQKRRIDFYQRLGARKLDFEYRFPTGYGSIPLDLYFLPCNDLKGMRAEEIKGAVDATFRGIYSEVPNWEEVFLGFVDEIKDQNFIK